MGAGNDFTITHDGTTGATIAGNPVNITGGGASTWKTTAGAITIDAEASTLSLDGHTGVTLVSSNSGEVDITSAANVDINATTGVTIDGTTVSIDGTDDMNFTVTSSTGGEDLTIQQIGPNDSSIIITAAGTGTDAVSIDATAGDMVIAPSLVDQKTLKLGRNGAVEVIIAPHDTAANEKFTVTNTAGTAADAIGLVATAGGVTITTSHATNADAVSIGASQTTKNVLDIVADDLTTAAAIIVNADGLEAYSSNPFLGSMCQLNSNSDNEDQRTLFSIYNQHADAVETQPFVILNKAAHEVPNALIISTGNDVESPALQLENWGANEYGPELKFYKNPLLRQFVGESAGTIADEDGCGTITFGAISDKSEDPEVDSDVTYAQISAEIIDMTDGSEDGRVCFDAIVAGTSRGFYCWGGDDPPRNLFNPDAVDLDFLVEASGGTGHLSFYVDAGNNRVSIGNTDDDPEATLEVTNHATLLTFDVPLVRLNSNDVNQIALDVNAANTTANVIDITAAALTTGKAIFIDHNDTATSAVTPTTFHLDFDKTGDTGASTTSAHIAMDVDMNDNGGNHANSTVTMTGLDLDIVSADATGALTNIGLDLNVSGADTNLAAIVRSGEVHFGAAAGSGTDVKFFGAGAAAHIGLHWDADGSTEGTLIGGADDHGVSFKFFGESAGKHVLWNMGSDELVLAAGAKLSLWDQGGGESILGTSDGVIEINAGTDVNINTDTLKVESSNSGDPLVIIKNMTNDVYAPRLRFQKIKGAAGADGDDIGTIEFYGTDDNQDQVLFAKILAEISDASNGAEGGKLSLGVASHDGEMVSAVTIEDGSAEDEVNVTFASNLIINSETADAPGAGWSAGVTSYVERVNKEVITRIYVDLGAAAAIVPATDGYAVGDNTGEASYLTRLTNAVNGVVTIVEVACVETPDSSGTQVTDLNLHLNSASIVANGQINTGTHIALLDGGDGDEGWDSGASQGQSIEATGVPTGSNAIGLASGGTDWYLYLTAGDSTGNGSDTYTHGKLVITLYGHDF